MGPFFDTTPEHFSLPGSIQETDGKNLWTLWNSIFVMIVCPWMDATSKFMVKGVGVDYL